MKSERLRCKRVIKPTMKMKVLESSLGLDKPASRPKKVQKRRPKPAEKDSGETLELDKPAVTKKRGRKPKAVVRVLGETSGLDKPVSRPTKRAMKPAAKGLGRGKPVACLPKVLKRGRKPKVALGVTVGLDKPATPLTKVRGLKPAMKVLGATLGREKPATPKVLQRRTIKPAVKEFGATLVRDKPAVLPPKAQKRGAKPAVKDLGVTLGLDKPVSRLTKVQKGRCEDDDLEAQRFEEELHKLNQIEEVLREANVNTEVGSDVDADGWDNDSLGELEDEDTMCPKPLPRRGRASRNKLNRQSEVPQEQIKEMCDMITQSTRKSLITNRSLVDQEDDDDDDDELQESSDTALALIKQEPDMNSSASEGNNIVFRKFRYMLGEQERWFNARLTAESSQVENYCKQLVQFRTDNKKSPLRLQLYYEHLSWLALAKGNGQEIGEIPISQNGTLPWFSDFRQKYCQRFPQLSQDGRPGSLTVVDTMLRNATIRVNNNINEVLNQLLKTRKALRDMIKHVTKVYYVKRDICSEFEEVHETLNVRSARFDESSVFGLKPIRLALEPPYLKTEDGLMAYPMTPDVVHRTVNYAHCFFKRDKQKWTTKDLQQLKACIKETLYTRRLCSLNDRYEVLMTDCLRKYEEELMQDGKLDGSAIDPYRRRRGRPKKSELEYSARHGIINPVIAKLPNGIIIRCQVSPRLLAEWRTNQEKSLKTKSYEELVYMENEIIDWETVANKMVVKSRKNRTAEDCELAFRHEVHPIVNDKRWGVEESRRLKDIYARLNNDWPEISRELNMTTDITFRPGRTPYQCFFRVRNRVDPPKKLAWTKELDEHVLGKLKEYPGNWRLVAASIDDPSATKRQVIERYKKTINPVLRNGAFTRVEDCLLILTIEKLKPFLAREGHFGCLLAYLPWRCETTWRDRANNLFSDWIVPWTLEEDKMLLQLAKTMNRNWQKISEEFTSFKNRKGCLTRYKILMRRLKDPRFNNSLEAYHEAYAMTRYNVFQYKHLKEILELLLRVKAKPLPEEHMHFVGLLRDQEPTEVRLQHMLLTFDKDILDSAIQSLTRYVQTRDNYWRNWISKHGKRKRTFDRRTFHPENPQSVASALHIRGLELRDKQEIPNLSDFENEIFKYYGRFKRTKALKQSADRPYIPDAKTLAQWHMVSRLVATSVDELSDVPIKRKWKALKSDEDLESLSLQKRKRLMTKASVAHSLGRPRGRKRLSSSEGLQEDLLDFEQVPSTLKKANRQSTTVNPTVNEEGYLLIPPEPAIKVAKQRRTKGNDDPEFYVPEEKLTSTEGIRRSKRVPKQVLLE